MPAPVLQIKGLTVRLPAGADREHAIEDIDLEVLPGETLCLVGESGSGKSVTAHAVMGLLPKKQLLPVAGEVLLQDEDLLQATLGRLRDLRGVGMAMVFQEPMTALNPVVPVGKQIDEMLLTHTKLKSRERARKVIELMDSVHMPEPARLRRSYPHQISGGQRQRVMIAMALALDPPLLIADEPTTALDVTTQAQILKLFKELQAEHGTGVLFITHDFGVVAEIADRVAVMQWGRIVETGTTQQILGKPEHPYTRMLVSSVPSLKPKARVTDDSSPIVLSTKELDKVYHDTSWLQRGRKVHAAADVSIEVRRGQTLGIVGESGSGKSTVARCIVRLIDPTAGQVYLDDDEIAGLPIRDLRPHRKRIQIIFQDPYRSLNPRITVGASIVEGPMNFGLPKAEAWQRTHELLDVVGIDPTSIDRFPHQFSGGQRQRICIARALAMEPEVLIADEAVSALDVSVQAQVLELLDDVRKRFNLAMLFITHDLRVAAQICDHVAVMHRGDVVEYGPAKDVFGNPQQDYTKALFDAAPGKDWDFGVFQAA
ncbi:MAG: ABC transporter ATP-binding protein [Planctomycetota bacterium]|jgi:peptide/nickel transport system ATP-binding protein